MAVFTSVEATEDTPNFILVAKPSNVVVYLSAETIDERTNWVEALRAAIPKARKKMKVRLEVKNGDFLVVRIEARRQGLSFGLLFGLATKKNLGARHPTLFFFSALPLFLVPF